MHKREKCTCRACKAIVFAKCNQRTENFISGDLSQRQEYVRTAPASFLLKTVGSPNSA